MKKTQPPTAVPVAILNGDEVFANAILVLNPQDAKKLHEVIPLTEINLANGRAKLTVEAALFQF